MEQWKQILMNEFNSSEVGLLDSDVTGIRGVQDAPDGIFYSVFSEKEAKAYHTIFKNFATIYKVSPGMALSGLEDDLNRQNAAVGDVFCPLELILFSSRCVNSIIEQDINVFRILRKTVGELLVGNYSAPKIVRYILGGWEWKTQMAVFVEAIGAGYPELVGTAMSYYPRAAELCSDDDKLLLRSYLQMILNTQNENNVNFLADVVCHDVFMNDPGLAEHFYNVVIKNTYWKKPLVLQRVVDTVDERSLTYGMRSKIADIKSRYLDITTVSARSVSARLNSRELSDSEKQSVIGEITFGSSSAQDIFEWERTSDRRASAMLNRHAMDNIDEIFTEENRGRAYIALATHSKDMSEEIYRFLLAQREELPEYTVSINIALYDMKHLSAEVLFASVFSNDYTDFAGRNLGKYFRYNGNALNEFLVYVGRRILIPSADEVRLGYSLDAILSILRQFNGNDNRFSQNKYNAGVKGLADSIKSFFDRYGETLIHSATYNGFIDIMRIIERSGAANRATLLNILDKMKTHALKAGNLPSVVLKIDETITRLDGIYAPGNT